MAESYFCKFLLRSFLLEPCVSVAKKVSSWKTYGFALSFMKSVDSTIQLLY